MKILKTKFKGLLIVKQKNNKDSRGNLREIYNKKIIKHCNFPFEYCTTSKNNSLRGFHFQNSNFQQAKFVNVVKGKILDCVIDLRKRSKTFGKKFKIILSEDNCLSLYIPEGFAHGYITLSEHSIFHYKVDQYYYPENEGSIAPNIKWPSTKLIISKKDKKLMSLKDFKKNNKFL